MGFCGKCGIMVDDEMNFCPACGTVINPSPVQPDYPENSSSVTAGAYSHGDNKDEDARDNKVMAILSYIGILVLIPLFAAKESSFARYHTNQGLALAIAEVLYAVSYGILSSVILSISWHLYFVVSIIGRVGIVFFILAIIGIINAVKGRMKPLPIIGGIRIIRC